MKKQGAVKTLVSESWEILQSAKFIANTEQILWKISLDSSRNDVFIAPLFTT